MDAYEQTQILPAELRVPPEFANYDDETEADTIVRLEEWKQRVFEVLCKIRAEMRSQQLSDISKQAEVINAIAPFDGNGPWILASTREVAQGEFIIGHFTFLIKRMSQTFCPRTFPRTRTSSRRSSPAMSSPHFSPILIPLLTSRPVASSLAPQEVLRDIWTIWKVKYGSHSPGYPMSSNGVSFMPM